MKDLGVLCNCRFCAPYRSQVDARWQPCGCQLGSDCEHWSSRDVLFEGEVYPRERVIHTGGRYGKYLLLEGDEEYVWLTSPKTGSSLEKLGIEGQEVARFPASVHGCWKVKKNQEVVVYKPQKGGES
jgi:hypothetical protein